MSLFLSVFVALFSVVNPLGAMPVYLSLTANHPEEVRKKIVFRTCIFFFIILAVFFISGNYIINFFGISLDSMRIAGGVIIVLSGYSLLYNKMAESRTISKQVQEEALEKEDVSLTPLAIPLLSGPGSISLLIGLYPNLHGWTDHLIIVSVILVISAIIYLIFMIAPKLVSILGQAGLNSISRIMGFIVMSIGVEFIISGTRSVLSTI